MDQKIILDADALINKNIFLKEYDISQESYEDFKKTITEQIFKDDIDVSTIQSDTTNTTITKILNNTKPTGQTSTSSLYTAIKDVLRSTFGYDDDRNPNAKLSQLDDTNVNLLQKYIGKLRVNKAYDTLYNIYITLIKKQIDIVGNDYVYKSQSGLPPISSRKIAITKQQYDKLKNTDETNTDKYYRNFIENFEDFTKVDSNKIIIDTLVFTLENYRARIIEGYGSTSTQLNMEWDKYKERYLKGIIQTKENLEDLVQRWNPLRVSYYQTYNAGPYPRERIKAIKRTFATIDAKLKMEKNEKNLLLLNIIRTLQLSPDRKYAFNRLNTLTPYTFSVSGGVKYTYLETLEKWLENTIPKEMYEKLKKYLENPTNDTFLELQSMMPSFKELNTSQLEDVSTQITSSMRLLNQYLQKSIISLKTTAKIEEPLEKSLKDTLTFLVKRLNESIKIAEKPKELSLKLNIKDTILSLSDKLKTVLTSLTPLSEQSKNIISSDIQKTLLSMTLILQQSLDIIKTTKELPIESSVQKSLNSLTERLNEALQQLTKNDLTGAIGNINAASEILSKDKGIQKSLALLANTLDKKLQATIMGAVQFTIFKDITERLEQIYQYYLTLSKDKPKDDKEINRLIGVFSTALDEIKNIDITPENIQEILGKEEKGITALSQLLQTLQEKITPSSIEAANITEAPNISEAPIDTEKLKEEFIIAYKAAVEKGYTFSIEGNNASESETNGVSIEGIALIDSLEEANKWIKAFETADNNDNITAIAKKLIDQIDAKMVTVDLIEDNRKVLEDLKAITKSLINELIIDLHLNKELDIYEMIKSVNTIDDMISVLNKLNDESIKPEDITQDITQDITIEVIRVLQNIDIPDNKKDEVIEAFTELQKKVTNTESKAFIGSMISEVINKNRGLSALTPVEPGLPIIPVNAPEQPPVNAPEQKDSTTLPPNSKYNPIYLDTDKLVTDRWAINVDKLKEEIDIIKTIINSKQANINDFHEILFKMGKTPILGKYIIGAYIIANIIEAGNIDKDMYKLTTGIEIFNQKLEPFLDINVETITSIINTFKSDNQVYLSNEYTILNSKINLSGQENVNQILLNSIFKILFTIQYDITYFTWRQLLENILKDEPLISPQRRQSLGGTNILTDALNSMEGGAAVVAIQQPLTQEQLKAIKEKIVGSIKSIFSLKDNVKNIKAKFEAYKTAIPEKKFEELNVTNDEMQELNTFFSTIYPKIEAFSKIDSDINSANKIVSGIIQDNEVINLDLITNVPAALKVTEEPATEETKKAARAALKAYLKDIISDILNKTYANDDTKTSLVNALNKVSVNQTDLYLSDFNEIINSPGKIIEKHKDFSNTSVYKSGEYSSLAEYLKKNGDLIKKDILSEAEKIKELLRKNLNQLFELLKPFEKKDWVKNIKVDLTKYIESTDEKEPGALTLINEIIRSINKDIDSFSSQIIQKSQTVEQATKAKVEEQKLLAKKQEYEALQKAEQTKAEASRTKIKEEETRAAREAAARAGVTGGGQDGGGRVEIDKNLTKLEATIDTIGESFKTADKKITNASDPAMSLALGDRSIFNALYQKYLESKQSSDTGGDMRATEELITGLEANQLLPNKVLAVNMRDKIIFIFATLFIRLFSLSVIEYMIEKGAVKNSNFAILGYLGLFSVVFIAFTLLVNLDMYRLRIVFNYINFHANSSNVYLYLALLWVFGGIIYYVTYYLNKDNPIVNSTDETKVRLIYRIQVISLIIWLFLVLMVSII